MPWGLESDSIVHKSSAKRKDGTARASLQSEAILDSDFLTIFSDEGIQSAVQDLAKSAVRVNARTLPKKADGVVRFMTANVGTLQPKCYDGDPSVLQRLR